METLISYFILSLIPNVLILLRFYLNSKEKRKKGEIRHKLFENYHITLPENDELLNKVAAFGYQVLEFFHYLCYAGFCKRNVIAHFHEWMAGLPIPGIRKDNLDIKTVFTTHATLLGRYLAMNDPNFYEHLSFYNWEVEATKFNVKPIAEIERASAHGAHVLTTVSEVTAQECTHLLGRTPDLLLPNGLNIERFEALHQIQNQHVQVKEQIHNLKMTNNHFSKLYKSSPTSCLNP